MSNPRALQMIPESASYDRWDIVTAHYAYYSDYHGGQSSREYLRLCKIVNRRGTIRFNPARHFKGYRSLSQNGKTIYRNLVWKYQKQ